MQKRERELHLELAVELAGILQLQCVDLHLCVCSAVWSGSKCCVQLQIDFLMKQTEQH